MKRTAWILALVMLVAMGVAQAQDSAQGAAGGVDLGTVCGLQDISQRSALRFVRSSGKWSRAQKPANASNNMGARVWHESNWLVDLHDAPVSPSAVHNTQLCFDAEGRITHMFDRYMEMAECRCQRFTALTFAPDGSVKQREETFVDVMTNEPMTKEPEAAKSLPAVSRYRRLDELPFYSLLKK